MAEDVGQGKGKIQDRPLARKPTLIKTDVSAEIIHLKMRIAILKGNTF